MIRVCVYHRERQRQRWITPDWSLSKKIQRYTIKNISRQQAFFVFEPPNFIFDSCRSSITNKTSKTAHTQFNTLRCRTLLACTSLGRSLCRNIVLHVLEHPLGSSIVVNYFSQKNYSMADTSPDDTAGSVGLPTDNENIGSDRAMTSSIISSAVKLDQSASDKASCNVRNTTSVGEITVVAQRCNSASLLIDNKSLWERIGWGAIFYVSFKQVEQCPTDESLDDFARRYPLVKAAKALLNVDMFTDGIWGDSNKPKSIAKFARDKKMADILIIPQAALVCKIKMKGGGRGKHVQYHNQCSKTQAAFLFQSFCNALRKEYENIIHPPDKARPRSVIARTRDEDELRLPPSQFFRSLARFKDMFTRYVGTRKLEGAFEHHCELVDMYLWW